MCTATWLYRPDGYTLFFNRDELRRRLPAAPPRMHEKAGMRFVAALDGNHGGSWLAVNEYGLTLCVLNGESAGSEPDESQRVSRGLLPTSLIDSRSPQQLATRLQRHEIPRFRAFVLAAFDRQGAALLARWDGRSMQHEQRPALDMPLVSSSFRGSDVRQGRVDYFRQLDASRGSIEERSAKHETYHRSHFPQRGPYSTCMHRPEARTVSFSRIDVDGNAATYLYRAGPPCREGNAVEVGLPLVSSASRPAPSPGGSPDRSSTTR